MTRDESTQDRKEIWASVERAAARSMNNPTSLSKSMQKAMGCPALLRPLLPRKGSALAAGSSNLADIGTEFHEYRAIYIQHLQQTGRHFDEEWIRARLASLPILCRIARLDRDDIRAL